MLSAEVCSDHIWAFIQNVLTDCPLGIHKQAGKVDLGGTSQKGYPEVVKMFQNRGTTRALVLASSSEKTDLIDEKVRELESIFTQKMGEQGGTK